MNSFGIVDKEYTGRRVTQQGPIAANQPIRLPIYISDKQQILVNIIKADGSTRLLTPNEYEYSAGDISNLYLPTINVSASETVHVMFLGAVPYDQVSESLTYQDIQNQIYTTATTSGTSTAYIATTISASVRSYTSLSNARVLLSIHTGNDGVASTLNLNNLGAKSIKQLIGNGTKIDAFLPTGYKADVMYDGVDWVLLNPIDTSRAPLASPSFTGTPTAPTAAVGTTTAQIANMAAVRAEFAARTYTSGELSFSNWGQILVTHTLGVVSVVSLYAKCIAATDGYSVGDIVALNPSPCVDSHNNIPLGVQSVIANNSVLLFFCSHVPLRNKVNGTWTSCNPASWRVIVDLVKQ